jgi:hypothetical protein
MEAKEQKEAFERLTETAKASGLLKFCRDGVAVICLPISLVEIDDASPDLPATDQET